MEPGTVCEFIDHLNDEYAKNLNIAEAKNKARIDMEDMSHIDLEPFREVFQCQGACNGYTEDDLYLIIKALSNEFVNDDGR